MEETELRRQKIQVEDPFADVRLSPVSVNGSTVTNLGVEILTDEGIWESVAIHSANYQLIPNADVEEAVQRILDASSHQWQRVRRIWTGRFLSTLYSSDLTTDIPGVGDAVALGLRAENSYDGSAKCRLVLMAYVLSCSNGLMSPRVFNSYALKHIHSAAFNINSAVGVLDSGMSVLEDLIPRIARIATVPLDLRNLSIVARSINLPGRDWKKIVHNLREGDSMWDLLMGITHGLTHHGRGRAQITNSELTGDFFFSTYPERYLDTPA
jgi:hypothetical protein